MTNTYDIVDDVLARANVDFCNSNCFKGGGRKQASQILGGGTYKTFFLSPAINFLSNSTKWLQNINTHWRNTYGMVTPRPDKPDKIVPDGARPKNGWF